MGRDMPVECPHGRVLDWGSFGPDSTDGEIGTPGCDECGIAPGPEYDFEDDEP